MVLHHSFPIEIIEDIFSKLPPKSLVRFMTLSKFCCSYISSPGFTRKRNPKPQILLLTSRVQSIDFEALSGDRSALHDLSFPADEVGSPWRIVGCCEGLVCLLVNKGRGLVIWNPCTRICKKLPYDLDSHTDLQASTTFDGFGYDQQSDDFKVVQVTRNFGSVFLDFNVFSLRRNSWRERGVNFSSRALNYSTPCVNGALHWYIGYRGLPSKDIVAFDLGSEKLHNVPLPEANNFDSGYHYCLALQDLNGCLCVCFPKSDHEREIWVMKEYGVTAFWTKLLTVVDPDVTMLDVYQPVCFSGSGAVTAMHDPFNMNDAKLKTFRSTEGTTIENFLILQGQREYHVPEATMYAETLTWPNNYGGTGGSKKRPRQE